MPEYFRPIPISDPALFHGARQIAGGWARFTHVEVITRNHGRTIVPANEIPPEPLQNLTSPRADIAGIGLAIPRLMGIVNVTPDSFSDGGDFEKAAPAITHANQMVNDGADILDIGGESTRPGADLVPIDDEINRVVPTIKGLAGSHTPISIDTRKSAVAKAAVTAGATIINDVSAASFDAQMLKVAKETGSPICLMHALGDPKTMQNDPSYLDVLLDVFDYLEERVQMATSAGISKEKIIVDPGIGFGKTLDHNLALLNGLSLFHGLGCAVLLGASRKRFIGTLGNAPDAKDRMPGSVAVALKGLEQGVQITRVHDIKPTKQAFALWQAMRG